MAKYPTAGKVKTRLASEIGAAAAARVYRALIDHHIRAFNNARCDVEWRYSPSRSPFRRLILEAPSTLATRPTTAHRVPLIRPQPAGDLGQRMRQIFAEIFARGYRRVIMIGTDSPQMGQGMVDRAIRSLNHHEAVFQPTDDGGYALIGLRRQLPLFDDIPWSTDAVMKLTRARLQRLGINFSELPTTYDIDTMADLRRWESENSANPTA